MPMKMRGDWVLGSIASSVSGSTLYHTYNEDTKTMALHFAANRQFVEQPDINDLIEGLMNVVTEWELHSGRRAPYFSDALSRIPPACITGRAGMASWRKIVISWEPVADCSKQILLGFGPTGRDDECVVYSPEELVYVACVLYRIGEALGRAFSVEDISEGYE